MSGEDGIHEKKVILPGDGVSLDDLARMSQELRSGQPLSTNPPLLNEAPMNSAGSVSMPNFQALQQDMQSGVTREKPNAESGQQQVISTRMRQWLRNPE